LTRKPADHELQHTLVNQCTNAVNKHYSIVPHSSRFSNKLQEH